MRSGGVDADWVDTEGFEISSTTMTVADATAVCSDKLSRPFLAALPTD